MEEFSYEDCGDVEWDLLLDALVSHVPRQQTDVNSIKIPQIDDSSDSESFLATLGKSSSWSIGSLLIDFEPGHEFWKRWAELAAKGKIRSLHVYDSELGCPEAMRKIWQAVTEVVYTNFDNIFKNRVYR